jgi:sulfite exporter TauE/SafE
MCGPIALALPLGQASTEKKWLGSLVYNSGRISTYALLGALFGTLGKGFTLMGTQQQLSVFFGALIVLSVFIPYTVKSQLNPGSALSRWISLVKQKMRGFLQQRSFSSLYLIGVLNGLLPCGLVYLAVAGAIASGQPLAGAWFMALFGLGTLPVMWSVALLGNFLSLKVRSLVTRSMPVMIVLVGMLFIVRGLNLGIPYLSPKMGGGASITIESCH